jgi:glyoxylase-like metal-dependent hydrolase (beta-lactamase superfamily II)
MSVVRVSPGVHRIESTMGSRLLSQWVVVGRAGAVLVDTGVAGSVTDHVVPALGELGLPADAIADVVITHADVDHYGGNAELRALAPGATLRAHRLDRPLIESWDRIADERYGWYRSHGLDYQEAVWRWLEEAAGPDVALDGTLADGDRIELGGIVLQVLELPGHSLGHLGLWEPSSRLAIVADAAMGYGFETRAGARAGPPPYVDLRAYRATLERLRALRPALLGTTHFPLLAGDDVAAFLDLSRGFTDDLERALDGRADVDPGDLLSPVAEALGGFPEMEVELARSIGAHVAVS